MTERFESVDAILDFAIDNEVASCQFYTDFAARAETPAMKEVFEEFAREEKGHKAKLEALKRGDYAFGSGSETEKVLDLGLADYLVAPEPKSDMNYAAALALAMKKEKAAYRLYLDLASLAESEELTTLFLNLAAEEAKHKLRFEIEFDDHVLKEA